MDDLGQLITLKLGVAGDVGSFSEEAALLYAREKNICPLIYYLMDMEGVLSALVKGDIELGIFPVVNSLSGLVKPAFEAMSKYLFQFVDELWLEINQSLLCLPDVSAFAIKKIISHPHALAQCALYLQNKFPGVELVEWIDTGKAARDLITGELPSSSAVIASERNADIYGLKILAKNIQNKVSNLTAFIIVKQ